MKKIKITEDQGVHKEWYIAAKTQTLQTLPGFLSHIMDDYEHDYGTICHALAAGGIATAWAMNKHSSGDITGFQAGCVMWQFVREWNFSDNKTGLKILNYDNMLFPQYADSYEKVLSKSTFEAIQKEAAAKIQEADTEFAEYLIAKQKYEEDIAAYIIKYPDYNERPDYYNHILSGTGDEWAAEKIKEESGFEFAPHEPYEPINNTSQVYHHWKDIVAGMVPFGFSIGRD